jgi:glycosyltransferase involved in cell wall biosynthesis
LRICILSVIHEPFDKRVYHKVGLSLAGAGHEIASICPPPAQGEMPALQDGRDSNGIRFILTKPATTLSRRFLAALRLVRLAHRERADVYLAPEPESWAAALAVKLLFGGKVVLDMHEHIPSEFAKFFPGFMRGFIQRSTVQAMRLMARFTDLVILTRESFEEPWQGLSVPRVTVINTNHFQPTCSRIPEALRERFSGHPVIIHQGIFGDTRGSYQLLDAVKLLVTEFPSLRCIVLGEYVYGSLEAYRSRVRELGLDENMVFIPPVPFEQVPTYIALAQVGLILFQPGPMNHTLAMPHKLFDYMREARPVVAPDFAVEVARIVREADCGLLVDVSSPVAVAAAVEKLLRNPQEAARLGRNGRRMIVSEYNWRREEKALLDAFSALENR